MKTLVKGMTDEELGKRAKDFLQRIPNDTEDIAIFSIEEKCFIIEISDRATNALLKRYKVSIPKTEEDYLFANFTEFLLYVLSSSFLFLVRGASK